MNTGKENKAQGARNVKEFRYGVYGLSEWVALIPAGQAKLRVCFAGGETSGYGRVPASFVTRDRSLALLIENSIYFKTGRIVRL
ncbi:MAG: hypothetical protein HDS71_02635 [Bacteroidales bacterium]|nr:hypothetical protein [Bacteroidales bacterium]MBD5222939.1 hypothetical protein [Bacteroidales bacterium]MBD5301548.1 hypothetical protein [Bacteroides sp.]